MPGALKVRVDATNWAIVGGQGPKGDKGDTGATGSAGTPGTPGTNGTNGVGVPTGGTVGQALTKIDSTNYNTQWTTVSGSGITQAAADLRYLQLTGGLLTGDLTLDTGDHLRMRGGDLIFQDNTGATSLGLIEAQSGAGLRLDNYGTSQTIILRNFGNDRLTVANTAITATVDVVVPDEAYGGGWNNSMEVPTKNALYDKIETIASGTGITQAAADLRYLQLTGGALTGPLISQSTAWVGANGGSPTEALFSHNLAPGDYGFGVESTGATSSTSAPGQAFTCYSTTTGPVYTPRLTVSHGDGVVINGVSAFHGQLVMYDELLLNDNPTQDYAAATKLYVDKWRYTAITTEPGTTRTLALSDEGKLLIFSSATAVAFTVPLNSTAAFVVGTKIDFVQSGAGRVTVSGATGAVAIQSTPTAITRTAGSVATLIKTGTDSWLLTGDLG